MKRKAPVVEDVEESASDSEEENEDEEEDEEEVETDEEEEDNDEEDNDEKTAAVEEGDSDEEEKKTDETDAEYELLKDEGPIISPEAWKKIVSEAEFANDLRKRILKIKPFRRCPTTARVIPTESFENLVKGIVLFLNSDEKVPIKVMKNLTLRVFGCCDILFSTLKQLQTSLKQHEFKPDSQSAWWNVFHFLKFLPNPQNEVIPILFKSSTNPITATKKKVFVNSYQATWHSVMKCTVPPKVLLAMIPFIAENVLDSMKDAHLTADFFFKAFEKGDVFAILSLSAIFKLIVKHNFEYPKFYDQVYALTAPHVLYTNQKQTFLKHIDSFLSSSHIPLYIVAGFVKRLCRSLLLAPLDMQEPIIGLIRNLMTRHPLVAALMHREIPARKSEDPYDENEPLLEKCGAMESSVWELKTLQKHWFLNVAKRANFVDKSMQKMESFVRYRCQDEYFSTIMSKPFGLDGGGKYAKYQDTQDGEDDEEEPAPKKFKVDRKKNMGKYVKNHASGKFDEEHQRQATPMNYSAPTGKLFPENAFNLNYQQFWDV